MKIVIKIYLINLPCKKNHLQNQFKWFWDSFAMACYNENKEEEEKWKSICLKRSTPCVLWKWVKKMIIFSIFKFVFTFPNISYNFLIFFPIEWIFPSDFFILFIFAFKWKSIVFPHTTTLAREAFTNENWQVLKKHTEWTCTHTHTSIIERVFLTHTNCQCL